MRNARSLLPLLAIAGLVLAACGPAEPPPEEADDPGVDQPQPEEEPETGQPDDGEERSEADEQLRVGERHAIELAAEELGVDVSAVTVVESELVTWSDGALGCPQEGEAYTQALVDGYRVVVEVDGEQLHYHGADGDPPQRCDDPQPPAERR